MALGGCWMGEWPWTSSAPAQRPTAAGAAPGRALAAGWGWGRWSFPSAKHWWGLSELLGPQYREIWTLWSWSSEGPLRCLRDSSSDIPDQPVESCGSAWTWSLIHMYKHLREGVQRRWGWTLLYELPREVVRSQSLVEDHHPMTLIWAGGLVSLS